MRGNSLGINVGLGWESGNWTGFPFALQAALAAGRGEQEHVAADKRAEADPVEPAGDVEEAAEEEANA